MNVLLAGHGHGDTMTFTDADVGSGWENLCLAFGGKWYSLDEAWSMDADAVLYIGTHPSVKGLADRGGKPPNWRRCVMLQEAGSSTLNDVGYASDVFRAGFDAMFVYSVPLVDRFALFGKPIYVVINGYPFHKHAALRDTPRERKVMLYLQQYKDAAADALGTLAMFKRLDDAARGVAFVEDPECLAALIDAAGLSNRITVQRSVSWRQFLERLATCAVAASMDGRQTWGRLDLDCALVGIRCVGPYTAAKARLFPDCIVDAWDVESCADLTQRELDRGVPPYVLGDDVVREFDVGAVAHEMRLAIEAMA